MNIKAFSISALIVKLKWQSTYSYVTARLTNTRH